MTALIYCPFPDAEAARRIGDILIAEGLIGCINIGGSLEALFVWQGERGSGTECPALLKTDAAMLDRVISRLEDLHPYNAPAILGWPCVGGSATNSWLAGLHGGNRGDDKQ